MHVEKIKRSAAYRCGPLEDDRMSSSIDSENQLVENDEGSKAGVDKLIQFAQGNANLDLSAVQDYIMHLLLQSMVLLHSLFLILVLLSPYPAIASEAAPIYSSTFVILVKHVVCVVLTSAVSKIEVAQPLQSASYLKLSPRGTKNVIMFGTVLVSCQAMCSVARERLDVDMVSSIVSLHLSFSIAWMLSTLDNLLLHLT